MPRRRPQNKTLISYLLHPVAVVAFVVLIAGVLIGAPLLARDRSADRGPQTADPTYEAPSDVETEAPVARQADPPAEPPPAEEPKTELIGFYVNWGEEAYRSLEANADKITVLMPMWYHVDSKGNVTIDNIERQEEAMRLIRERAPQVRVMPLVNNYDKATETWNAPAVSKLLARAEDRKRIARNIVNAMVEGGFAGVNIDFENFTEKDRANLVAFMGELYPLAKDNNLTVSMDVIVGSKAYDHAALAKNVDYMIPMMYDEHWKTSGPGSISGIPWYTKTLRGFWEKVPPEKTVIGIGTYSYDWGKAGQRAASLTWQDARELSQLEKRPITLDPTTLNSRFSYEKNGITRQVWMLDAVSAFNQISSIADRGPRGYAIWRMGAEDPGLWNVLENRDRLDGEVAESLTSSARTIQYDADRRLITGHRIAP